MGPKHLTFTVGLANDIEPVRPKTNVLHVTILELTKGLRFAFVPSASSSRLPVGLKIVDRNSSVLYGLGGL